MRRTAQEDVWIFKLEANREPLLEKWRSVHVFKCDDDGYSLVKHVVWLEMETEWK